MSQQNNGNQHISYKYRFPAKGSDFSQSLRGLIKPGFYSGGELSNIGNEITITPFKVALNCQDYDESENNKFVIVETELNAIVTANDITKDLLYISYSWQDALSNYADFDFRSSSGIPATNEVIIGTCTYNASGLVSINTDNRTYGLFDENYNANFDGLVTMSSGIVENDLTVSNDLILPNGILYTDDIQESSSGSGVVIERVLIKDGIVVEQKKEIDNEDYTLQDNDIYDLYTFDNLTGDVDFDLATLADYNGKSFYITNLDGSYDVIITPEGAENINDWNSTFEITEKYGIVKVTKLSDRWLVLPLNDACIYEVSSETADTGLDRNGNWDDVTGMTILNGINGEFILSAKGNQHISNTSSPDGIYGGWGLGTISGNNAPNIPQTTHYFCGFGTNDNSAKELRFTQSCFDVPYSSNGSTVYMKAIVDSDVLNVTGHVVQGQSGYPMFIKARRVY